MRSKLLILVFALVSVIIVFNEDKPHHNQFGSDAGGYYLYLPAIFIYHDLEKLKFCPGIDSEYHLGGLKYLHNINGKKLNKYPVGVSVFELPLFLLAHIYCHISHQYKADGFTLPYQLAGIFSNVLWVITGLFILRRFLKQYFNDNVTAITLLAIAFGTNLYAYTSFQAGMSHSYSFFLFSCLLYLTDAWYKEAGNTAQTAPSIQSMLLGLTLGFIYIVRPINIVVIIIPVFWNINDLSSFKERIRLLRRLYKEVVTALLFLLLAAFIQFACWKDITGHWLCYSYIHEGFNFLHPEIWNGLFSYRKGWFVYTPMAFAGLTGFYYLWKKDKGLAPALAVFFLVMIYIVFSWHEWWYGGGFGCRPLIETLALLSLPLAALTEHFLSVKSKFKKTVFFTLFIFIITLNIFQTYQYSMGLINWSKMTKGSYWFVFGKTDVDRKKLDNYLIRDADEYKMDNAPQQEIQK